MSDTGTVVKPGISFLGVVKTGLMYLFTLFIGASVYFLYDIEGFVTTVSGIFLASVAGYLGVDIARMLIKTTNLPPLKYEPLKRKRYIHSSIQFVILFSVALYLREAREVVVLDNAITLFGAGFAYCIGAVVIGLQANSVYTKRGPEVKDEP